jgi:hypothetical protein
VSEGFGLAPFGLTRLETILRLGQDGQGLLRGCRQRQARKRDGQEGATHRYPPGSAKAT